MISFIENNIGTIVLVAALAASIPIAIFLREMIEIKSQRDAGLFGVMLMFLGTRCIGFFYQLCGWIMPGILHSGVFGIFCFGVIVVWLLSKLMRRNFGKMLDFFAILMALYGALNRVCCLVNGCCSGVNFGRASLSWPNRELEVLFFFAAFVLLLLFRHKRKFTGQLFLLLMIGYGLFRFFNEFLSKGQEILYVLKIAHIWSFLCVAIGFSVYVELNLRADKLVNRKKHGGY